MKSKVFVLLLAGCMLVGSPACTKAGELSDVKGENVEFVIGKENGAANVSNDTNIKEANPQETDSQSNRVADFMGSPMGADISTAKRANKIIFILLCLLTIGVLTIVFVVLPVINIYKSAVKSKEYKTLQEEYDKLNCKREGQGDDGLQ